MNTHLKILGWFYLIIGAISFATSGWLAYKIYGNGPDAFATDIQKILIEAGYGTMLLGLAFFSSVGSLITGFALLKNYGFARTLALIFAILGLIDFPFGTTLGVYTFWVLSNTKKQASAPEKPQKLQ